MGAIRNVIITLIILAGGIYLIQHLGEGFLQQPGLPAGVDTFADLMKSVRGLTDILLMGIGALIVLLIIVWAIRKSSARPKTMPAQSFESRDKMEREMRELEQPEEEREPEREGEQSEETEEPSEEPEKSSEEPSEEPENEEERRQNEE